MTKRKKRRRRKKKDKNKQQKPHNLSRGAALVSSPRIHVSVSKAKPNNKENYNKNCETVYSIISKKMEETMAKSNPGFRPRRDFCFKRIKRDLCEKESFIKTIVARASLEKYVANALTHLLSMYDMRE